MPHTAARNLDSERIGCLNRVAAPVFRAREALERFKKRHRRVHYAVKYAAILSVLYVTLRLTLLAR
jgi:hypothetical protein